MARLCRTWAPTHHGGRGSSSAAVGDEVRWMLLECLPMPLIASQCKQAIMRRAKRRFNTLFNSGGNRLMKDDGLTCIDNHDLNRAV